MALFLDGETLTELKCSTCKNYMSVGPVSKTPNGYNCGRCPLHENNQVNSLYEVLAKKCFFPCRYDVSGCKEQQLLFGDAVVNHEKTCEYRLTSCPVDNSCEWSGAAIDGFVHCLKEHGRSVVENFEFEIDLRKSMDAKKLMQRGKEVFWLHLLYSEMGLSVSVALFVAKHTEQVRHYNLLLQSSDATKTTTIHNREVNPCYNFTANTEWISGSVLHSLDKTKVLTTVEIETKREPRNGNECLSCGESLPLYLVRCRRGHKFCKKCHDGEQCAICNAGMRMSSNYDLMKTEQAVFTCCNANFGCTFLSNYTELKKHEGSCKLKRCIMDLCNWKGFPIDFWKHIVTRHKISPNKIDIEEVNFRNSTYLIWITAKCNQNQMRSAHTHRNALFIVETAVNEVMDTIRIVANYVPNNETEFTKGHVKITVGINHLVYEGDVGCMSGLNVDKSCAVHICRSLFKEHKIMCIELVKCEIKCL